MNAVVIACENGEKIICILLIKEDKIIKAMAHRNSIRTSKHVLTCENGDLDAIYAQLVADISAKYPNSYKDIDPMFVNTIGLIE